VVSKKQRPVTLKNILVAQLTITIMDPTTKKEVKNMKRLQKKMTKRKMMTKKKSKPVKESKVIV